MRILNVTRRELILSLTAAWLAAAATHAAEAPKPAAKDDKKAAVTAPVEAPVPQAAFSMPSDPSVGRNPFYPNSTMGMAIPKAKESAPDITTVVLNGITSPPRATAMINGRTFEAGEEGEVRLPSGNRLLIRCLEVRMNSALVEVAGMRRELRLRSGDM